MSGGYFDYSDYAMNSIADELERIIEIYDSKRGEAWLQSYDSETINAFRCGLKKLKEAAIYIHRIDYLLSTDDSEEDFHLRLADDLSKI